MLLLVPNVAVKGKITFAPIEDPPLDQDYMTASPIFPGYDPTFDLTQTLADVDVEELLQVEQNMFFLTDLSLQEEAVDMAISTLQEGMSTLSSSHTHSHSSDAL